MSDILENWNNLKGLNKFIKHQHSKSLNEMTQLFSIEFHKS